jgi:hypothetical protein
MSVSPTSKTTTFMAMENYNIEAPLSARGILLLRWSGLSPSVGDRAPARGLPVKHPLMHRTRSLDYAVVLSSEVDMMLGDSLVHLKPGDVVVRQATNHGWINRGTQPCRILFVLMDSKEPSRPTYGRWDLGPREQSSGRSVTHRDVSRELAGSVSGCGGRG